MMSTRHSELVKKAKQYLIRYGSDWKEPVICWGRGAVLKDVDGREFLDFSSGQMCATLGHNHPRVVEAIQKSLQRVIHLNSSMLSPETITLAERLAGLLPHPLNKSILLSTGSESNEVAIKLAKHSSSKFEIVGLTKSFHGLTLGSGSCTYSIGRRGHGPVLPGFALPAPYCYRCPVETSFPGCDFLCLRFGFSQVDAQSVGSLAACLAEPIVSAGGVIEPPPGYLSVLKSECEKRKMLFILDEAQTAFGRMGSMFAFEQEGATPHILTLSKTLGGGIPISAVVTSSDIEEAAINAGFFHITSHVSDPLPSAVALAVLDIIQEENLTEAAKTKGEYLKRQLILLADKYEIIGDVRGRGLLIGVEFVHDRKTKEPAEEAGARITQECMKRGLSVNIVQFPGSASVWRMAPPLTVTQEELDKGLAIIEESIRSVLAG
jgi:2,2-dialkylglycine decarboxylase (pyruvate)